MKAIKLLTTSLLTIGLVSCAANRADPYDTGNVYGYPDASMANPGQDTTASLYDTPAAYDESDSAPDLTAAEPASSSSYYRTHTVTRGDTLSGISAKYNVKMSAIVRANNIKNKNLLSIGTKLIIPSR